jgi:hypothetical protein
VTGHDLDASGRVGGAVKRLRGGLAACLALACLLALGACGAKQDALSAPARSPSR